MAHQRPNARFQWQQSPGCAQTYLICKSGNGGVAITRPISSYCKTLHLDRPLSSSQGGKAGSGEDDASAQRGDRDVVVRHGVRKR